jgi:hypothetical protein
MSPRVSAATPRHLKPVVLDTSDTSPRLHKSVPLTRRDNVSDHHCTPSVGATLYRGAAAGTNNKCTRPHAQFRSHVCVSSGIVACASAQVCHRRQISPVMCFLPPADPAANVCAAVPGSGWRTARALQACRRYKCHKQSAGRARRAAACYAHVAPSKLLLFRLRCGRVQHESAALTRALTYTRRSHSYKKYSYTVPSKVLLQLRCGRVQHGSAALTRALAYTRRHHDDDRADFTAGNTRRKISAKFSTHADKSLLCTPWCGPHQRCNTRKALRNALIVPSQYEWRQGSPMGRGAALCSRRRWRARASILLELRS